MHRSAPLHNRQVSWGQMIACHGTMASLCPCGGGKFCAGPTGLPTGLRRFQADLLEVGRLRKPAASCDQHLGLRSLCPLPKPKECPDRRGICTESVRGIWQASMPGGDARHVPAGHAPRGPRYNAWVHGGGDERCRALAGLVGCLGVFFGLSGDILEESKSERRCRNLPACQPAAEAFRTCLGELGSSAVLLGFQCRSKAAGPH